MEDESIVDDPGPTADAPEISDNESVLQEQVRNVSFNPSGHDELYDGSVGINGEDLIIGETNNN